MPYQHTFGEPLSLPIMIVNSTLPLITLALTTVGLGIDWQYVALALGSSLAGSLLFGYVRREGTIGRQIYKVAMSTIAGVIFGSALVAWRGYQEPAMVSLAYCVAAMLVLIFLRTVVSTFEENAEAITKIFIQKIFTFKVPDEKPGRGNVARRKNRRTKADGIHLTRDPGGKPTVTIDEGTQPDEVRIVEETVIEKTKEK